MAEKQELKAPAVVITRHQVALDPPIDVFNVELKSEDSVWSETWGSEDQLRAFLRGIKAGCGMIGVVFYDPEIPERATSVLAETTISSPDDIIPT